MPRIREPWDRRFALSPRRRGAGKRPKSSYRPFAAALSNQRLQADGRGSGNAVAALIRRQLPEVGQLDLVIPRDRAGTFEPVTVPRYQRQLGCLAANVLSLYARGMTTGEIASHLEENYGTTSRGRRPRRSPTGVCVAIGGQP